MECSEEGDKGAAAMGNRDDAEVASDRVDSVDSERAGYAELPPLLLWLLLLLLLLLLCRLILLQLLRVVIIMGGSACTVSSYRRLTRWTGFAGGAGREGEAGADEYVGEEQVEDDIKDTEDIRGAIFDDSFGLIWFELPPTLLNRCSAMVLCAECKKLQGLISPFSSKKNFSVCSFLSLCLCVCFSDV